MANQAIRQEINIIDVTVTGTGTVTANAIVQLDTTKYSGTPTYWFEACFNGAASNTGTVKLRDIAAASNVASLSGATSTTYIVSRVQFTPTAGAREYTLQIVGDGSRTQNVHAARIIILQSESVITQTGTQIEIGNQTAALSNTSVGDVTNPKFWKYDSANWDGTTTFSVEVVWLTSSKNTTTITLCRTSDNAANVTVVSAGSNTVYNRTRVSFTPVNGETYKLRSLGSTSKSTYTIACGKIVVNQGDAPSAQISENNTASATFSIQGGTAGSGETNQQQGQSFTTTGSFILRAIEVNVNKSGTPTDDLFLELASSSISGTTLVTSSVVTGASIVGGALKTFNFSGITLDASTKYYFRALRSGARDTSNFFVLRTDNTSVYPDGGLFTKTNNSWGSESATVDANFIVDGVTTQLTKIEAQYLLLNTGDAGTGAQNMLTTYNASEWDDDGGTTTITHLMDSDNASNSAKIVTAAGADTGSSSAATGTLQIESGAFTLTDATNYDTNVTNSTGVVAASRLKFAYIWSAAVVVTRRIFVTGG